MKSISILDAQCNYYDYWMLFPQISMSVMLTMPTVIRNVKTLLGALCVTVTMDMNWMKMDLHVMVSLEYI